MPRPISLFVGLMPAPLVLSLALAAHAQETPPEHDALMEALQVDRVVSIMHAEGVEYGETLAGELFPGRGREGWRLSVARIYDEGMMRQRLREGISGALVGQDVGTMLDFFEGEDGARIIELELAAREALADDAVEEAAQARWATMEDDDPRLAADVVRFIEVNDLVEENVVGALNANVAFMTGLSEGGAFEEPLPEADILADVWSSEPEIRADMEGWLGGFLSLAYEPLEEDALEAYIEFSESGPGQALNRALFEGFDAMYEGLSFELGRAAAAQMAGQDI